MYLLTKRSRKQTVLSWQQMPKFRWIVSTERKSSNVRFPMESAKQTSLWNVRFPEMFRYIMRQQAVRALPQMQKQAAEQDTRSTCS